MKRLIKLIVWAGFTSFGTAMSYMACFQWPEYAPNRSCDNGVQTCQQILVRITFPTTLWLFFASMVAVGFVSMVIFALFELWEK